jgi:hypothetical protein
MLSLNGDKQLGNGLITRMTEALLNGLWVYSYISIIWLFRLIQKMEHQHFKEQKLRE